MPDHAGWDNTSDESTDIFDLLDLIFRSRPSFHADAACKQVPANVIWFPRSSHGGKRAKRICSTCPAFEECRVWSLAQGPSSMASGPG